jgi:hypothetical protein
MPVKRFSIPVIALMLFSLVLLAASSAGAAAAPSRSANGQAWACGNNYYGQLGDGTNNNSNAPVTVSGLTGARAVAAGYAHSIALRSDGTVRAWGFNDQGQLGDGTNISSNVPVTVSGLTGARAVAAGYAHSIALKSDGTVRAWGANSNGQLGDGTNISSNVPVTVSGLTGVTAVAAGGGHSLFVAPIVVTPTVITQAADGLTASGATLYDNISSTGNQNSDERGFRYRQVGTSTWTDWTETGSFGTATFYHPVTGLTEGTGYEYQAMAHNSAGWAYGTTASFTTANPTPACYLAEGTNAWGFSTYITIENAQSKAAQAKITYMDPRPANAGGGIRKSRTITLPALSQTTVSSMEDIGPVDFSTKVECEGTIAVDRTMFWDGPTGTKGYHSSIGTNTLSKTWYLPEGSSAWGFETWTAILNPNATDANIKLSYMTADGPVVVQKTLPANCRATYSMAADIGTADASIKVESDICVVAERSMYRNNRREGSCSIGATAPASDFYLAEGAVGYDVGFTTYVLIQNPNNSTNDVKLTYQTPGGPALGPHFTMKPNSRQTVKVNDGMPANTDVSTVVHGSKPIIAERAVYWDNGTGLAFHASIGLAGPHKIFLLPDGQTSEGFETWTLVENPNSTPADVVIHYFPQGGGKTITFTDTIPAASRRSYSMVDKVPSGRASVLVTSESNIIVERSMYMNNRGAGTDTIGTFFDMD